MHFKLVSLLEVVVFVEVPATEFVEPAEFADLIALIVRRGQQSVN